MSRLISLVVGMYVGIVMDQNFQVPKMPVPTQLIEQIKQLTGSIGGDDKKK